MLAVREVDDDWWDKPSCGSLSVNSYGQITVEKINEKYKIILKSLDDPSQEEFVFIFDK